MKITQRVSLTKLSVS